MKTTKLLGSLLLTAVLSLACLPAKADPQTYTSVTVTNVPALTNTFFPVTNINASFKVPQNAQLIFQPTFQVAGTNNLASTSWTPSIVANWTNFTGYANGRLDFALLTNGVVTFGYNFTVGDTNWTTTYPYTNTFSIPATNLTLVALSIGQKNVSSSSY